MVVTGHLPLTVALLAGDLGGDWAPSGRTLPGHRAARTALHRFRRAALSQGARLVAAPALPGLMARSAERSAHEAVIRQRLSEIAAHEQVRDCPRCAEGCAPSARWCPRCEYEFTHHDDHTRDETVLRLRREADQLRHTLARLALDGFPPLTAPAAASAPGPWGGMR